MLTLEQIRRHFMKYDALCRDLDIDIIEVDANHSVTVMTMDKRHLNGVGNAHGAALFAQVDVTFAALANASGLYCTNAQTSMSFLAPGRISPLRCEAKPIHVGRKLGTYEVRLTDAAETLVVVATISGYFTGVPLPIEVTPVAFSRL